MNGKIKFHRAAGMAAFLFSLHCATMAGVLLGGTRVVFGEKDREGNLSMKNTGISPYIIQAWSDAGEGQNKTPFVVTPPLSRLDPGRENILRIMRGPVAALPADRESVFWLNVKEIPEKSSDENVLQVAVRSRIKLFYRPSGLPGKVADANEQLQWAVAADGKGGSVLKVANPTPYHITLTTLNVNGGQQVIDADMAAPCGELAYPLTAVKSPQEVQVAFSTINDYGGVTDRERVRVPVAEQTGRREGASRRRAR
ncbi:MAG: molecular chaperone [Proteobacteria bacterium]|nr:molecular chaperone [Pseudomonadota bacterium]